jgi:aldehyde dehydrogenase (NAD+)
MNTYEIPGIIETQRVFFNTHKTKDLDFRIQNLKKLKEIIQAYEDKICLALWEDLHKPKFEAYATEVGLVLQELTLQIRKLKKWSRPKKVKTSLIHFFSRSYIHSEPYGNVLIFAPWNFPFQLLFNPLLGAISAGNCVVMKPSKHTPHIAEIMEEMISSNFDPAYIALVKGGKDINKALLNEKFDYIFFTGSQRIGRIVMEAASRNLTPVCLELGGKNPCIVDKDANINLAAKRITWSKFFNAGQTCVAPDYLLIHKDVKEEMIAKIKFFILSFYGSEPKKSQDYNHIVNQANVERLSELIKSGKVIFGGEVDITQKYVAPTLIDDVKPGDPVMQEEIFGPVLPILEFNHIDEALGIINNMPKSLSLYIYTNNSKLQKEILHKTSSGNGAINDSVIQFSNPLLPYGGVGESGMGKYHGKKSFETFSNLKSIMKKTNLFDLPVRYPPYSSLKLFIAKKFMH